MNEFAVPNSAETKERPKRVVLEIGVGSHPHYSRHILGKPHFAPEDQYIAFDITEDRLKFLPREPVHVKGKKPDVVRGDALELPFANETIDEIILPDILNSIIVSETDVETMPDGTKRKMSYDDIVRQVKFSFGSKPQDLQQGLFKIIDEACRVLKHSGKLTVFQRLSVENSLGSEFRPFAESLEYLRSKSELNDWKVENKLSPQIDIDSKSLVLSAIKK